MDWLIALFSTPNSIAHILLAYSIVIALGMALGKIKIFGVSLGVTFVLFTGLLLNYLGMKVDPTVLVFFVTSDSFSLSFLSVCKWGRLSFHPLKVEESF